MSAVRNAGAPDAGPASLVVALPAPYLLFLGDVTEAGYAKTAFGLRDWARELCVGEFAMPEATVTTGLPRLTPREAHATGARSIVIGVANTGGVLKPSWIPSLVEALEAGLDVVSGMHGRLATSPRAARAPQSASAGGSSTSASRRADIPVGTGRKRTGKRLLDGRHRLRARQEIHGARDRTRDAPARRRLRISAPPARPGS